MTNLCPLEETLVESYEQELHQLTDNRFLSLRQLSVINATDQQLMDRVVNVYGVIDSVNNVNELHKRVVVMDPTTTSGVAFIINNINTNIVVKNIIRLTNVSLVTASEGKVFAVNERKNFAQFYSFSYDYSSDNPYDYEICFAKYNINYNFDKPVAKLLELWFAKIFLKHNSFDKLSIPTGANDECRETYADFACLVIASQLMRQSIQLTVYDGSQPNISVQNQFRQDFGQSSDAPSNQYHHMNTEALIPNRMDNKCLVFVNIWRNKSNQHNDHYDMAERTTLLNGDDLLVLFNVQIMRASGEQSVKLHLRSGRHHGKGIRKVNRNSVLGRLLIAKIKEREWSRRYWSETLQTCPTTNNELSQMSDWNENSLNADIDQILMNELLALGIRRLQALKEKHLKEKTFPNYEKSKEYEYDLNLIERALEMSRQLSKFPNNPLADTVVPNVMSINDLESNDWDSSRLILIRAKIINTLPKCVFPANKFIKVKCISCNFIETFHNYRNSILSNITTHCPTFIECPNCKSSEIKYFYAILFTIEDSNGDTTRVCLTKQNVVTVFGVNAKQILEEPECAVRVDNILCEMTDLSDEHNGIEWVIKKRNATSIHEVITLRPLNTISDV